MGRKAGDVLGAHVLRERVGGGPSSEVWKAVDRDGRDAALRVFLDGRERPPLRVGIDVLRSLVHPNIARVFALESDCLIREWMPGASLEGRALTREEAASVLAALAFAHAKGVVHGRLGPANVFSLDGAVKVADFGLAGSEADPKADVRALGGMLAPGDPWGARMRAGDFASADAALAARPADSGRRMPSWIAGPLLVVGAFLVAYVGIGVTMAGLQPSLRLIAAAAGAGLCAVAWRYVERPLLAAVFWGALLWGFGARVRGLPFLAGAWGVALVAGGLWVRGGRRAAR